MLRHALPVLAALPLAACATPAIEDTPASSIEYSLTPCFGFCPSFSLAVNEDGKGTFDGERFVAHEGPAQFTASRAQAAAFARRLAPFRPESSVSYGYENCDGPVATDSPSVKITWREPGSEPVTLKWYMGCRQPGLTENRDALYKAWRELPVDELVGSDEERQTYGRVD
ncbi:DUF6438 domain-containing protein [Alteriqipengyuania lutimaris]|uniref:DUF6438 domain-containing protein n=1 Tax=Alteriqipengyuania lutimaris TaxID=1538146 RepID=A0A395LLV2_9SPHN|nr:DUF6438 domain-containing protein [Alteriqipengyuania lutimaris]MBB3032896.1 hypothetical protein [Alteriqipengyuania lutimaris]RDS78016.1 hypothetical protein DL238_10675 [Alteriqipengyuania lutimaris]